MRPFTFSSAILFLFVAACATPQPTQTYTPQIVPHTLPNGTIVSTAYIDGKLQVVDETGKPRTDTEAISVNRLLNPRERVVEASALWQTLESGEPRLGLNDVRHIGSGGICPARFGTLVRTDLYDIKPDGSNVGCRFEAMDRSAQMQIYFYRDVASLDTAMADSISAIEAAYPDAEAANLGRIPVGGPNTPIVGKTMTYQDEAGRTGNTSVWIMDARGWRLKVRMSYPATYAERYEEFMSQTMFMERDAILSGSVAQ